MELGPTRQWLKGAREPRTSRLVSRSGGQLSSRGWVGDCDTCACRSVEPRHAQRGSCADMPTWDPYLTHLQDWGRHIRARGGVGGQSVVAVLSLQKRLSGGSPLPKLPPFQSCL